MKVFTAKIGVVMGRWQWMEALLNRNENNRVSHDWSREGVYDKNLGGGERVTIDN